SFDQYLGEKKLMGSHCPDCDLNFLPPRAICPQCFGDQLDWVEFNGDAKLAAFTAIYIAPTVMIDEGYGRDNPYLTGIVELDHGVKISAQVLGLDASKPGEIQIGLPMKVEYIERGEGEEKGTFLAFRAA
ncbi:MAG: Zn-ribbon domain-containing OB-fold protein, partial [Chloroflexota bacterium]